MTTFDSPTPLVVPFVSINGSSKRSLLEDSCEAARSIRSARETLQNIMPNGRDYQGPENNYQLARTQHLRRLEMLDVIEKELNEISEKISDQ